jgi:hypothetical protein
MDSGPQSDIEDLRQRAFKLVIGFGDAIKEDTNLVKSIKEKLHSDDDSDDDLDDLLSKLLNVKLPLFIKNSPYYQKKKMESYIEADQIRSYVNNLSNKGDRNISEIMEKEKKINDIRERITELEGILETTTRETPLETTGETTTRETPLETTGERPSIRRRFDMFLDTARMYTKQAPREVANTTKRLFNSAANRVYGRGRSKKSKSKNTKKSRGKRNMVKSLKKRQKHKTKSKKKTKNTI